MAGLDAANISAFVASSNSKSPYEFWDGMVSGASAHHLDSRASIASTDLAGEESSYCSRRSSYAGGGGFGIGSYDQLSRPTHSALKSSRNAPDVIQGTSMVLERHASNIMQTQRGIEAQPSSSSVAALQQLSGLAMQRTRPPAAAAAAYHSMPLAPTVPPTLITPRGAHFQADAVEEIMANFHMSKVIHNHVQQKKAWHALQLQKLNDARDSMAAAQAACYQSVDALGLLSKGGVVATQHLGGPRAAASQRAARGLSGRTSAGAVSRSSSRRREREREAPGGAARPNTAPEGVNGEGSMAESVEDLSAYPEGAYLSFPDSSFGGARPLKGVPEKGTLFERYAHDTSPSSLVQSFYLRPYTARTAAVNREAAAAAAAAAAAPAAAVHRQGRDPARNARSLPNGVPRSRLDLQRATHEQGMSRAYAKKMQVRASMSGPWEGLLPPTVTLTQTTTVTMIQPGDETHNYNIAEPLPEEPSDPAEAPAAAAAAAADAAPPPAREASAEDAPPPAAKGKRPSWKPPLPTMPDVRRSGDAGGSGSSAQPAEGEAAGPSADAAAAAAAAAAAEVAAAAAATAAAAEAAAAAAAAVPVTGIVEASPQAVKALLDNSFFESMKEHFKEASPLVEQTWKLRAKLNANLPSIVRQIQGVKEPAAAPKLRPRRITTVR